MARDVTAEQAAAGLIKAIKQLQTRFMETIEKKIILSINKNLTCET